MFGRIQFNFSYKNSNVFNKQYSINILKEVNRYNEIDILEINGSNLKNFKPIKDLPIKLRVLKLYNIFNLVDNIIIPGSVTYLTIKFAYNDKLNLSFQLFEKLGSNIVNLNLSNNNIAILPKLPNTIKVLNLSFNYFTNIDVLNNILPDGIENLNLSNNKIKKLLYEFKDTIKELDLSYNNLEDMSNLHMYLPNNLIILDISGMTITDSFIINKSIREFRMNNCKIYDFNIILDIITDEIRVLEIGHNYFVKLGKLPDKIEDLDLSNNVINNLENILPNNLNKLYISNTKIKNLPKNLPLKLEYINCLNSKILENPFLENIEIDYSYDENYETFICIGCEEEICLLDYRFRKGDSGINYCQTCINTNDNINKYNEIITVYKTNWYCDMCDYHFRENDIRKHINNTDYDICMTCYNSKKSIFKYPKEEYYNTSCYYITYFENLINTLNIQLKIHKNNYSEVISNLLKNEDRDNYNILKYLYMKFKLKDMLDNNALNYIFEHKIMYLVNWVLRDFDISGRINYDKVIYSLSDNYTSFVNNISNVSVKMLNTNTYNNLINSIFLNNSFEVFMYLYKLRKPHISLNFNELLNKFVNECEFNNIFSNNSKKQILENYTYKIEWYLDNFIKCLYFDKDELLIKFCLINNLYLVNYLLENFEYKKMNVLYKCFIKSCHNNNIEMVKSIYKYNNSVIDVMESFVLIKLCIRDGFYDMIIYLDTILNDYDITFNNYAIFKYLCVNYNINNITSLNINNTVLNIFVDWYYNKDKNINLSYNNDEFFYLSCINNNIFMAEWLLDKKPDINISVDNDKIFMECCDNELYNICDFFVKLRPSYYIVEYTDSDEENNNENVEYRINRQLEYVNSKTVNDIKNDKKKCNICLEDNAECYTSCNHVYCFNCLNTWYKKNNKCPYCRRYLTGQIYKI